MLSLEELVESTYKSIVDICPYVAEKIRNFSLVEDGYFDINDPCKCIVGLTWYGYDYYRVNEKNGKVARINLEDDTSLYKDLNLRCCACTMFCTELAWLRSIDEYDDIAVSSDFLRHTQRFARHIKFSHPALIKDILYIRKWKNMYKDV